MDYKDFIEKFKERQKLGGAEKKNAPTAGTGIQQNNQRNVDKSIEIKNKILNHIREKGPSLPSRISQEISVNTLFVSAFLSELSTIRTLRISHIKIGSSPLYYLPGQEERLTEFEEFIKGKEKEAYELLKNNKVIRDSEQEPAIRVALRSIKDYAHPIVLNKDGKQIIYWRFLTTTEEAAKEKIMKIMEEPVIKKDDEVETETGEKKEEVVNEEPKEEQQKKEETITEETKTQEQPEVEKKPEKQEKPERKHQQKTPEEQEFSELIKESLKKWDIEVMETIEIKRKEALLRVRMNTDLGKMELLAICKDKKRITDIDLALAVQKSQNKRMPCLFITPGEMNKKAESYYESWKNIIKFKKIRPLNT